MGRSVSIKKEDIIKASIQSIRENGIENLSARNIAKILNSSIQPIFYNFESVDELKIEALKTISDNYNSQTKEYIKNSNMPPYKASGLFYIKYAQDEPELFKALFMRNRNELDFDQSYLFNQMSTIVEKTTEFDLDTAREIHLEMWTVVHGIAVMQVTNYLKIDLEKASEILSNIYLSRINKKD